MTGQRLLGLGGLARVEIVGACPEDCLTALSRQGIRFRGYRKTDELTASFEVAARDLSAVRAAAEKAMCGFCVQQVSGLVPMLRAMGLRLGMLGLVLLAFALTFFLQERIWFVKITGAQTVPEEMLRGALEECGIVFFAPASEIDVDVLRNEMLEKLPELGWMTLNFSGGVANVEVRERREQPERAGNAAPCNIVAGSAGIITAITAPGGTAQVSPGDVVMPGQVLISGVTDLQTTVLITRAEGEVFARTFRQVEATALPAVKEKQYTGKKRVMISLHFGKNTINLFKTSGISGTEYDKMIRRKVLSLPGGWELPVSIDVITAREYRTEERELSQPEAEALLTDCVRRQVLLRLRAGQILNETLTVTTPEGSFRMTGRVECQEEIGEEAGIME